MIEAPILTAIEARLRRALGVPDLRYRPLVVGGDVLGWLDDGRAERLARLCATPFRVEPERVVLAAHLRDAAARTRAMAEVAAALRAEGALPGWRDETYAVAEPFGSPAAFHLERGAARWFGVRTWAAHVNGVVPRPGGTRVWFARRSARKFVDPGMLDNLVGGGVAAGASVAATVEREAWEEAGIPGELARRAVPAGAIHVRRAVPDGLQRETLFVHDLELPPDFIPANRDGEAVEHRLVDLAEAARLIAQDGSADDATVDASLVVLDFLIRHGAIVPDAPNYLALEGLRHRGRE